MKIKKSSTFILGAGNHGVVIAENCNYNNKQIYFLDDNINLHNKNTNKKFRVLDSIDNIDYYNNFIESIILGIGENYIFERENLFKKMKKKYQFLNSIHKTAVISKTATIGCGVYIGALSYIGSNSVIGDNTVIYPGVVVEHGCKIESNVYISPGVNMAGNVTIKKNVFLGIGVNIIPNIFINEGSYIAGGAVVIKNTIKNGRYKGVPAEIIN